MKTKTYPTEQAAVEAVLEELADRLVAPTLRTDTPVYYGDLADYRDTFGEDLPDYYRPANFFAMQGDTLYPCMTLTECFESAIGFIDPGFSVDWQIYTVKKGRRWVATVRED